MKSFRLGHNITEYYTSFEECAKAWGCKSKKKDEEKMRILQQKFCTKYRCPACGNSMGYVGGDVMTCINDKCKGIKVEREDYEGNKYITYEVSYKYIKDHDISYVKYIFS